MNHIVILQLFSQTTYGSESYGSETYSSTSKSSPSHTSVIHDTLADTGMATILPISGGVFLIVTALAVIGYRIKRRK